MLLGAGVVPALLQLLLGFVAMPESPRWRRSLGARDAALRAPLADGADAGASPQEPEPEGWKGLLAAIRSGRAVGPLRLGVGLQVLQQVSGINVAVYYGPQIFVKAGFDKQQADVLNALVSAAQMIAMLALSCVIDRVGRRPVSLLGLIFMVASLLALAVAFLFHGVGAAWMACAAVLIYRVAFSISLGPLPYIVCAEIFPSAYRAVGVSVTWGVNWAANFVVSLTFPLLTKAVGEAGVFFLYTAMCVLALWFVWACMAETTGRTLEELEDRAAPLEPGEAVAEAEAAAGGGPRVGG